MDINNVFNNVLLFKKLYLYQSIQMCGKWSKMSLYKNIFTLEDFLNLSKEKKKRNK